MESKLVLFDLDGTLMDTLPDLRNSINQFLEVYGFPPLNDEEVMSRLGHGFRNLVRACLPEGSKEELYEEALNMFVYYYDMNYFMESRPYEGMADLLKELSERGFRLAVYSNKREDYTQRLIEMHFRDIPFEAVWGAREDVPIKPDPARLNALIGEKGYDRNSVIMVGDGGSDCELAKNAEIVSVLVTWGYRSEEHLREKSPDYLVHNIAELRDTLLNLQ